MPEDKGGQTGQFSPPDLRTFEAVPILKNERHELFAQKLAEGKTATEAYELAGFRPSRKNASRLRAKEDIARATAEKAKISGLLVERQQVELVNADPYENLNTHQEILAKVVEDCGVEAARALAVAFKLDFDEAAIMALCSGASGSQRVLEWQPPQKSAKRD